MPTLLSMRGGGGKKRKKYACRYPRWAVINGHRYLVKSADEERQLLSAMRDRAEDAAKTAKALGDEKLSAQSTKSAARISKRVAKVDSREDEWIRRLYEEDEELLLLLQ